MTVGEDWSMTFCKIKTAILSHFNFLLSTGCRELLWKRQEVRPCTIKDYRLGKREERTSTGHTSMRF